jgi:hypothetical protein
LQEVPASDAEAAGSLLGQVVLNAVLQLLGLELPSTQLFDSEEADFILHEEM